MTPFASSDRDDQRIFLKLKFSILGFLILGIKNNLKIRGSAFAS